MRRLAAASLTAALIAAPGLARIGFAQTGSAQTAKPSPYRTYRQPSNTQPAYSQPSYSGQSSSPGQTSPAPNPYASPSQISTPDRYRGVSDHQYQGVSHPPDDAILTNDLGTASPASSNPGMTPLPAVSSSPASIQPVAGMPNAQPGSQPGTSAAARAIQADQLSATQMQPEPQPRTRIQPQPLPLSTTDASTRQPKLVTRTGTSALDSSNPDYSIVTSVPAGPNQLAPGTIVKIALNQKLSTEATRLGALFSGRVIAPVKKNGRIVIPVGSTVTGRVTEVSAGRRITGGASIHLRPDEVVLPNGVTYLIHAVVYDVGPRINAKPGSEGNVVNQTHGKRALAEAGLFGGGAAAAVFVAAGGPAALIAGGAAATYVGARWLFKNHQAVMPKGSEVIFGLTQPMNLVPYTNRASLDASFHANGAAIGSESR